MTNETKTDDVHSISNAFNWKDSIHIYKRDYSPAPFAQSKPALL